MTEVMTKEDLVATIDKRLESLLREEQELVEKLAKVRDDIAAFKKARSATEGSGTTETTYTPRALSQRNRIRAMLTEAGRAGLSRRQIMDAFPEKRSTANANISMMLKTDEVKTLPTGNVALKKLRKE